LNPIPRLARLIKGPPDQGGLALGTSSLPFLVLMGCSSFALSLAFPFVFCMMVLTIGLFKFGITNKFIKLFALFFSFHKKRRRRPRQGWYAQEKGLKIDLFRFEILGLRPTYQDQGGLKVYLKKIC
jgi:hypothetical protein